MASTNDKKIQEYFDIIQKKKSEIIKAEKPTWLTNCSFAFDPNMSNRINLQTVSDVAVLAQIAGWIMFQKGIFDKGNELLKTESTFKWMGYTESEWLSDIQTRATKIQITKKKQELEEYETVLNKLISPELRAQMELERIGKMLES